MEVKLPVVSSDDIVRALRKAGFSYAPKRGKGSHMAFYNFIKKKRGRGHEKYCSERIPP